MSKKNQSFKNPKPLLLMSKTNYMILVAGLLTIIVGFLLMSGGASTDPNVFNEDIFSFRRIRLAPSIVLIGFGIVFYSIFYKKKQ